MYNPFRQNHSQTPFLSPLGKCRKPWPSIAAPFAVILIGGFALVAASGAMFSGLVTKAGAPTSEETLEHTAATAEPGASPVAPQVRISDETAPTTLPSEIASPMPDRGRTAAIEPTRDQEADTLALSFNAPVAANEGEVALLEVIQMEPLEENQDQTSAAPRNEPQIIELPETAPAPVVAQSSLASGLRSATISSAVNLRAAPNNRSKVLLVVPAGARIEAQSDCGWCAVDYEGNQGFIYKSFINYR